MPVEFGELVGSNFHLVEKIFLFSNNQTLLQCRAVCKLWGEEATRILRMRGVPIAFRSIEDIEEFIIIPRPVSQTFNNFLIDIPSSCNVLADEEYGVPCQIIDLLDLCKDEIQKLKLWYKPLIKQEQDELIVNDDNVEESSTQATEENETKTLVKLVNLENLQLLSNYVHPPTTTHQGSSPLHRMPKYFSYLSAPKLRSLAVQLLHDTDCSQTIASLIKSSSCNLEYLKIPAKPFLGIAQHGSVNLEQITELDLLGIFHGFSCATIETVDHIINRCPNLKKLGIEFSFRVTQPKIQELWRSLAGTLEELKCTIQDRNLLARQIIRTDFIFPEMIALKSLQMRWSNPGFLYYIDRLPVLQELMLDTVWTRKIQGNLFPNGQAFQEGVATYPLLASLKLTECVSADQIKAFSAYFPNLQTLGCSFDSDEALRTVYETVPSLKWLTIERRSNIAEAGGLCGLEENDLEKLAETLYFRSEDLVRKYPSIVDLKDLETLELCQLGVTWQSLMCGVVHLSKLKTLVIQSKAFKELSASFPAIPNNELVNSENSSALQLIASNLINLRKLTLWIRHSSERPSATELKRMEQEMPWLSGIGVVNHSLCGI